MKLIPNNVGRDIWSLEDAPMYFFVHKDGYLIGHDYKYGFVERYYYDSSQVAFGGREIQFRMTDGSIFTSDGHWFYDMGLYSNPDHEVLFYVVGEEEVTPKSTICAGIRRL